MKKSIILLGLMLFSCSVYSQTKIQKERAFRFYNDLINSEIPKDTIINQYLYIKPLALTDKSIDRNSFVRVLIDSVRNNAKISLDSNKFEIKNIKLINYKKTKFDTKISINKQREKDIFALYNGDKRLLYLLFHENRIESFGLMKKGKMTFFITY